jgi:hypothetical protein
MGVGASINTTSNNISTSISQSLVQKVGASATANCNVTIGSISFTENKGCSVTVSNMCSASATGTLDAVLDGAFNAFDQLTTSNQQDAAQLMSATLAVNTTVTNIKKDFSNYISQQCGADSNLNQNIKIQNIELGKCSSPGNTPINFNFINSGSASANCAIGIIQKLLVDASNSVATSNEQTSSTGLLIIGLILIAGMFFGLIYIWYIKQILFRSTEDSIRMNWSKRDTLPWVLELDMLKNSRYM